MKVENFAFKVIFSLRNIEDNSLGMNWNNG